jgi:hypothetical protein
MRKLIVGLMVVAFGFSIAIVQAQDLSMVSFYEKEIDSKIAQRESQAQLLGINGSRNLVCDGRTAMDQANFYRNNKEALVQQMLEQEISNNPSRVEYFLIRAYFDHSKRGTLYACKTSS